MWRLWRLCPLTDVHATRDPLLHNYIGSVAAPSLSDDAWFACPYYSYPSKFKLNGRGELGVIRGDVMQCMTLLFHRFGIRI